MVKCDCNERIETKINSLKKYEEMKNFFKEQIEREVFTEIPVEEPYYIGRSMDGREIRWYADKWYKCIECGIIWEFVYPDFPAQGYVKKIDDSYSEKGK